MRLLVVYAHLLPESYNAAVLQAVSETARARGHDLRVTDLYAQGFNPVMSAEERRGYMAGAEPPDDLRPHIAHLAWAEGLVFVYPTWWYAPPAILKGWLDRVWRPGSAFLLPDAEGPLRPALTHIRQIGVITTCGSPWWLSALVLGSPGRKILLRGLRFCLGWKARSFWMALYDMDMTTPARRAAYLARVRARIARLPL